MASRGFTGVFVLNGLKGEHYWQAEDSSGFKHEVRISAQEKVVY